MSMPDAERSLSELDVPNLPVDVFFGDVVYEPGGTYGPRLQPHYQLLHIHSGHVVVEIAGTAQRLQQGEVALLKPGHWEFFSFAETVKTHHRWCQFDWSLPEASVGKLEALAFQTLLSERMTHLIDLGLALQHDPHTLTPSLQHLAAAAFWEFVGTQARARRAAAAATLPLPITLVQTYVVHHYADDLTLAKLGRVASVTPEHLSRLFRKHLDLTPTEYVWQVRVQQSVSYLRHTGLPLEQIAYQCGFKTAAHFSRTIKARFGTTPGQLRYHHWQGSASKI